MPIYEYRCQECGERFSKLVRQIRSADEETPPVCVHCGSADTVRAVSRFSTAGPSGPDPAEQAAQAAQAEHEASITPKEQIDSWRSAKE